MGSDNRALDEVMMVSGGGGDQRRKSEEVRVSRGGGGVKDIHGDGSASVSGGWAMASPAVTRPMAPARSGSTEMTVERTEEGAGRPRKRASSPILSSGQGVVAAIAAGRQHLLQEAESGLFKEGIQGGKDSKKKGGKGGKKGCPIIESELLVEVRGEWEKR